MSTTPGTRPSSLAIVGWLVAAVVAIAVAVFVVLNASAIWNSFFPPQAKSVEGQEIRSLYDIVFAIAVVIFVVVEGLIIWSVVRYRRRPGDNELPPQTHGNNLAEITWTVIPTAIVIFLFIISWQTLNSVEATSAQPDLRVRAVAGQFQWSFDYLPADAKFDTQPLFSITSPTGPDGGLVLPAGKTTHLFLKSRPPRPASRSTTTMRTPAPRTTSRSSTTGGRRCSGARPSRASRRPTSLSHRSRRAPTSSNARSIQP